ncbi:hypothetical protein Hanom_Chr01g00023321 [Helianthus anomalus]
MWKISTIYKSSSLSIFCPKPLGPTRGLTLFFLPLLFAFSASSFSNFSFSLFCKKSVTPM